MQVNVNYVDILYKKWELEWICLIQCRPQKFPGLVLPIMKQIEPIVLWLFSCLVF